MTYDRRTGKPIASAVTKIAPEVVIIKFILIIYISLNAYITRLNYWCYDIDIFI